MRMRMWSTGLLIAGLLLAAAGRSRAADEPAQTAGSVSGTTVDAEGHAVAGAQVTALMVYADHHADPKAVKTVASGSDGTFRIEGLEPSGYILKASTQTLAGNKSATVRAGQDTAIGKLTMKAKAPPPPSNNRPRKG